MAQIASIDVEVRIPDSSIDIDNAEYEYMLGWYNADGGFYSWLFTDFIRTESVESETINAKTNPSKIFTKSENSVQLVAEDITENQYHEISKILRTKNIWRIWPTVLNKEPDKVAILSKAKKERKTDGRYNFNIVIQEKSPIIIT